MRLGSKHTEQTRALMSAAKRGRPGNNKGKWRSELSRLLGDEGGVVANCMLNAIRKNAAKRNKAWELSATEAFNLFTSKCHYCDADAGFPVRRNGIDRVDNSRGYTASNCVPCCKYCNAGKADRTLSEFKSWAKAVSERFG
jgi:hypothetical protein